MPFLLQELDCEFCTSLLPEASTPSQSVASRVVATRGEMLLVADRAPMTLGHLLLIPREHHRGMASFLAADPGVAEALHDVVLQYREAFGGCTVIEHGTGAVASAAGPCIDHAHWHLLPYRDELTPIIEGDYGGSMRPVGSLAELARECADADYLLYWNGGSPRVVLLEEAALRPQYARSVVARYLFASAQPYDWDWALRADDSLLVHTLDVARRHLSPGTTPAPDSSERETT